MIKNVIDTIRFIKSHPIGGQRFSTALGNYLRWQIGTRILKKDVVHKFVGDTRLIIKKGMVGATGNVYVGIHEYEHMSFLLHFCNAQDVFFDIGANVGTYSVLASGVRHCRSVAFEPIKATFASLQDNIRLNDLGEICTCLNAGAGDRPAVLSFTSGLDTMNRVSQDGDDNMDKELVNVVTVDSLLVDYKPTIMKIDVEGFELNVLKGAGETLALDSLEAIIIELNEYHKEDRSTESAHELLTKNSFDRYRYLPESRSLLSLEGVPQELGNSIYICCKHFAKVSEKLKRAPSFSVLGVII